MVYRKNSKLRLSCTGNLVSLLAQNSDFSDEAIIKLYNHESYGTALTQNNGFAIGKRYLNLQVTSQKEALLEGSISKIELYEDENIRLSGLRTFTKPVVFVDNSFVSSIRHIKDR